MKKLLCASSFLILTACGPSTKLGTIAGGECQLAGVHTPKYQVKGKTRFDQNWADDVTEGLVRGCNQPRPLARPARLDMPVKARPIIAEQPEPIVTPKPRKKRWWQRK